MESIHDWNKDEHAAGLYSCPPISWGIGLVLILHSLRSTSMSCVTTTPILSSLIYCCRVFLERSRRLVPDNARSTTMRVTLFEYLLWTCPTQRRRLMRRITDRCEMQYVLNSLNSLVAFDLRGDNLPLAVHLHRPELSLIRYTRSDYSFSSELHTEPIAS